MTVSLCPMAFRRLCWPAVLAVIACGESEAPRLTQGSMDNGSEEPGSSDADSFDEGSIVDEGSAGAAPGMQGSDELDPNETDLIETDPESERPTVDEQSACEGVSSRASAVEAPQDIIIVLDTSGSMGDEITAIEQNINENFADVLRSSGIDFRVVLISAYRSAPDSERFPLICVGPPLGPTACETRTRDESPHVDGSFYHFDHVVASKDAPCTLLDSIAGPPNQFGALDPQLQDGWGALLRPEAFKVFMMFSDDEVSCSHNGILFGGIRPALSAAMFDEVLRTTAPQHFGEMSGQRRYTWHSIVGLADGANAGEVYAPEAPLVEAMCETAREPGLDHQALSQLTGGLRYPVCEGAGFDSLFRQIATEIVVATQLPCRWAIPQPPNGEAFNRNLVNLSYLPGDGSEGPELARVDHFTECGDGAAWYYDSPEEPTTIFACPAVCEQLASDDAGAVDIWFGCETRVRVAR